MFSKIYNYFNQRRLKDEHYHFLFEEYDGDEVVIFDTETSGLDPKKDEILSIGALKVKKNSILTNESFYMTLKPTKTVCQKSITIHHLRNCDLEDGCQADEAIETFLHFIGSRPLVGYYLEFDVAMINRYIKPKLGITLPNKKVEVSALYYDKKIALIPQGYIDLRFDSILKDLNLPKLKAHNALNDAMMTALIYIKLNNKINLRRQ
ncbi:MAG: DNA polymerase III subunit epsilon [Sulfurovum sp. AS07-7]|nr:MAG: DNA polymerase III subunit epsilon [Sulfurovum sp. AS07-7]